VKGKKELRQKCIKGEMLQDFLFNKRLNYKATAQYSPFSDTSRY
jgi:hypothetical protein